MTASAGSRREPEEPPPVVPPRTIHDSSSSTVSTSDDHRVVHIEFGNRALLDPNRYGWSAAGPIIDLMPPHERARRRESTTLGRGENGRKRPESVTARYPGRPRSVPRVATNDDHDHVSTTTPTVVPLTTRVTPSTASEPHSHTSPPLLPPQPHLACLLSQGIWKRYDNRGFSANTTSEHSPLRFPALLVPTASRKRRHDDSCTVVSPTDDLPSLDHPQHTPPSLSPSSSSFSNLEHVDLFAYHRGREGHELRDENTGELCCDVPMATDTQQHYGTHHVPPSKDCRTRTVPLTATESLVASVCIEFPLGTDDVDEEDDISPPNKNPNSSVNDNRSNSTMHELTTSQDNASGAKAPNILDRLNVTAETEHESVPTKKPGVVMFRQVIPWDLASTSTPSPEVFAAMKAEQFGLTLSQTFALTDSIQKQLGDFVRRYCTFAPPMTMLDVTTGEPINREMAMVSGTARSIMDGSTTTTALTMVPAAHAGPRNPIRRYVPVMYGNITDLQENPAGMLQPIMTSVASDDDAKKGVRNTVIAPRLTNTKVEKEYAEEVIRRLRLEGEKHFLQTCTSKPGHVFGELNLVKNASCHQCANRRPLCAQFSCRNSHCLCLRHLSRYGIAPADDGDLIDDEDAWRRRMDPESNRKLSPWTLSHCPICSITCACIRCERKRNAIAIDFKQRALEQSTSPENTKFPDILTYSTSTCFRPQSDTLGKAIQTRLYSCEETTSDNAQLIQPPASLRKSSFKTLIVGSPQRPIRTLSIEDKLPPNSKSATARDPHNTGKLPQSKNPTTGVYPSKQMHKERKVVPKVPIDQFDDETMRHAHTFHPVTQCLTTGSLNSDDGSTDFCIVCRKHGEIVCCDHCPRAYHQACLNGNGVPKSNEEKWHCPACRREEKPGPEHFVSGEKSLEIICALLSDEVTMINEDEYKFIHILSILHEMVIHLISYDFGIVFRTPVDPIQCPAYQTIVKKPKDLGTIAKDIVNGYYVNLGGTDSPQRWDGVITGVLTDIELVWHNCFLYNLEGSAVYRMAQVQRLRAANIRSCSFEHLINDEIKRNVYAFVRQCEVNQKNVVESSTSTIHPHRRLTPVAVVDPDSECVVKVYPSLMAASRAVRRFLDLKFPCEIEMSWGTENAHNSIRRLMMLCEKDRSLLYFGYRWVGYSNLNTSSNVESTTGTKVGSTRSFDSPRATPQTLRRSSRVETHGKRLEPTRNSLVKLNTGHGHVLFASLSEALLFDGDTSLATDLRPALMNLDVDTTYVDDLKRHWTLINPDAHESINHAIRNYVGIVLTKEDLLSGAVLAGYSNFDIAFRGWMLCSHKLLVGNEADESEQRHFFGTFFVDSGQTLSGLIWRRNVQQTPVTK